MMRDAHLTPEDLELLLARGMEEREARLFLHHLAVCPECFAVGGYVLELFEAGAIALPFCAVDIGLARSRAEAPGLWQELSDLPVPDKRERILEDGRFHSWGLCELLCDESLAAAVQDAKRALALAQLAVDIAQSLGEWQPAAENWLEELRGFAWAHLANARRVLGDLPGAERAFQTAERHWQPAWGNLGDVLGYEVRYLALAASLRREERRFPEALRLIDLALELEAETGLLGKLLVSKAKILEESGDLEEAIATLEKARAFAHSDPRLALSIEHNLIWLLAGLSRFERAYALLPSATSRSRELGNELDLLRLRWVEGAVLAGRGDLSLAEEAFQEVKAGFASREMPFDAALVSLELAHLFARTERIEEARGLASEILPIFEAQAVDREAIMTLALSAQAGAGERVLELLGGIIALVRRGRFGPARHMEIE